MESLTIKLPSKEYSRIEATVVAMYEKLGIDSVPIDPFNIANRLGFVLRPYSQLPIEKQLQLRKLECEAINFYDPESGAFIICYDDSFIYTRVRFTIMHEIGHILLEHKQESQLARKMADYFAAYALAPSPLIHRFGCDDFVDVHNRFDVSVSCASACFQRYRNWLDYGGGWKPYEKTLLSLL